MADNKAEQIMSAILNNISSPSAVAVSIRRGNVYDFEGVSCVALMMGSDEPLDIGDTNVSFLDCDLEVIFTIHVKGLNLETLINEVKKLIIIAMAFDYTQGLDFVLNTTEQGWEKPVLSGAAEQPTGQCDGRFKVKYRRSYTDPSA